MVLGKYVPQLSFLDILLGNEEVFEPPKRRLSAALGRRSRRVDRVDRRLSREDAAGRSLRHGAHPGMAMTETHWQRGEINDERHKLIFQSLKETVEELGEREQEIRSERGRQEAKEPEGRRFPGFDQCVEPVHSLPARADEADEIAGTMLAQLSATRGCVVEAVSVTSLASEMVELVEQRKADVVCISAMPPAAATHARYLCKRLQGRFPDAHLIVGLWNAKGDLAKMEERIGCGATTQVVANLAAAQEKIHGLLQPLLHRTDQPGQKDADQFVMAGALRDGNLRNRFFLAAYTSFSV